MLLLVTVEQVSEGSFGDIPQTSFFKCTFPGWTGRCGQQLDAIKRPISSTGIFLSLLSYESEVNVYE